MKPKELESVYDGMIAELTKLVGDPEAVRTRARRNRPLREGESADDESTGDNKRNNENHDDEGEKDIAPEGKAERRVRINCDRCDRAIPPDHVRLKCKDCPDFDYCPGCSLDAKRTHPGHRFEAFQGDIRPAPGKYNFVKDPEVEAMKDRQLPLLICEASQERPEFWCRSCRHVALALATWHITMLEAPLDIPRHAKMKLSKTDWTVRIAVLAQATSLGCPFCAYILEKFFGPGGPSKVVATSYVAKRRWYLKKDKEAEERRYEVVTNALKISSRMANDRVVFRLRPSMNTSRGGGPWLDRLNIHVIHAHSDQRELSAIFEMPGRLNIDLPVFGRANDPATADVIRHVPNALPASEEGLVQAHSWYRACLNKHGAICSPSVSTGSARLPTRVIDVSDTRFLRIRETGSANSGGAQQASYCVLSYQWGGPQTFCLSTASLSRLKEGFTIEEVPATIADAVKVTRNLGMQYLWIDALCILQDDEKDRAHEILKMEYIYRCAAVTIIAANAGSVNHGFLRSSAGDETKVWRSLIPFKYPVISGNGQSLDGLLKLGSDSTAGGGHLSWATLWIMDDVEHMDYCVSKDPVTKRSWCLQERLLSPRVLNYGRWPTWRCNRAVETDGGFYISDSPKDDHGDEFARLLSRLLLRQQQQPLSAKPDQFTLHRLLTAWYGTVNDYTKRQLSDAADRLPAIGGIASLVSQVTGMEYLAGLWRDNLLHDLTWYADTREWLSRPAIWRAPTWSWASVECAATYGHVDDSAIPVASVISCTTEEGTTGRFGGVLSGELSVEGPFRRVALEEVVSLFESQNLTSAVPKSNRIIDFWRQLLEQTEEGDQKLVPAEVVKERLPDEIYAMVTFRHSRRDMDEEMERGDFYTGLLLQPVGDHYERIGSFKQENAEWMDIEGPLWKDATVVIH